MKNLLLFIIAGILFVSSDTVLAEQIEHENDPIVMFNLSNRKYHNPSCEWAGRCTKNCIHLRKSESRKRGGIPCRVCGEELADGQNYNS